MSNDGPLITTDGSSSSPKQSTIAFALLYWENFLSRSQGEGVIKVCILAL